MPDPIESVVQTMAGLFAGRSREEQKRLLAALERAGAAVYRSLAENEDDASAREGLLAAAATYAISTNTADTIATCLIAAITLWWLIQLTPAVRSILQAAPRRLAPDRL